MHHFKFLFICSSLLILSLSSESYIDNLEIDATSIIVSPAKNQITFSDNVLLNTGKLILKSDRAIYNELDKTIEELKGVFMEELALLFPLLISEFSTHLNKDLQQQWELKFRAIIQHKIIKASMPFRWVAFVLGAIWGFVIVLILPLI